MNETQTKGKTFWSTQTYQPSKLETFKDRRRTHSYRKSLQVKLGQFLALRDAYGLLDEMIKATEKEIRRCNNRISANRPMIKKGEEEE